MVTVLLGAGWFANFRVYERDKDALRRELSAQADQHKRELEAALSARLDALRPDIEAKLAQRVESVEASTTFLSRRIADHISGIEREQRRSRIALAPSADLALTQSLMLLKTCVSEAPEEISDMLHLILKNLDKGGKFTASEITTLNEELGRLPTQYQTLSEKLRSRLVASDIF